MSLPLVQRQITTANALLLKKISASYRYRPVATCVYGGNETAYKGYKVLGWNALGEIQLK